MLGAEPGSQEADWVVMLILRVLVQLAALGML